MKASEIRTALAEVELPRQTHSDAFLLFFRQRAETAWGDDDAEVPPLGYLIFESLVIHDLAAGVDGFTGERIPSCAVGLPELAYNLLAGMIRRQFPQEFQDELTSAMARADAAAEVIAEARAEEP